jgi:hypothetical protein
MTEGQILDVELARGMLRPRGGAALDLEKEQIRRCGRFQGYKTGHTSDKKDGADFVRPSGLLRPPREGTRQTAIARATAPSGG